MKQLTVLSLLFLMLPMAASIASAGETTELDRLRVTLNDGQRFEAHHGLLTTDSLFFRSHGDRVALPHSDIRSLERLKGRKTRVGMIVGAVVGAGVGVVYHFETDQSQYYHDKENAMANAALAGGLFGAMIGTVLGSTYHKWESVPLEPGFEATVDGRAGFKLTLRF